MLTVEEAIKQRRTIRHFKREPISKEMVMQMLEAARLAPSGANRQPWRFVVVTDAEEKKKLRALCLDQAFLEEVPVVFIACADSSAYARESRVKRVQEFDDAGIDFNKEGAGLYADPAFRQKVMIDTEPNPAVVERTVSAMTYIATEHLILMATALGLGSCWVGAISDREAVKTLLGIPTHISVVAIVCIGYPQYWPPARPRLSIEQILLRPIAEMK